MSATAPAMYTDEALNDKAVLIVDDKKEFLKLLGERLKNGGIKKIHKAASAQKALQIVRAYHIKVVILDIVLDSTDGISIASDIQELKPEIKIIFHTGFDDEERRTRAAQLKIQAERWIDKGPGSIDKAASCALQILSEQYQREKIQSISCWINAELSKTQEAELDADLVAKLAFKFMGLPQLTPIEPPSVTYDSESLDSIPHSLEAVIFLLKTNFNEIKIGYMDIAHRTRAWTDFRRIVSDHLWDACEAISPPDPYRRQLADQFEQAISIIEPHQVTVQHIESIELTLQYLSSDKVDKHDVRLCERAWRKSKVPTAPSFSEIVERWEEYYGTGDN